MTGPPGDRSLRGRVAAHLTSQARRARATLASLAGLAALAVSVGIARAADPSASPGTGGDVRTDPAAPGLVGDPLFAVLGVALVAVVAVGATLVAIRLADRP